MSYISVFRSLEEIFPQVDLRVLKAVAIEHSKDTDAAVECILFEVLPNLCRPLESHRTPTDSQDVTHSIVGGEEPKLQRVVEGAIAGSPSNLGFLVCEDANDKIDTTDAPCGDSECLNEGNLGFLVCEDANDKIDTTDAPCGDSECLNEGPVGSSVLILQGGNGDDLQTSNCGFESASLDQPPDHIFLNTETEELISSEKNHNVIKDLNELTVSDSSAIHGENHQDQSCLDADLLEVENLPATIHLIPSCQEDTSDSAGCGSLSAKVGDTNGDFEKPDSGRPSERVSEKEGFFDTECVSAKEDFNTEVGNVENGSSSIPMVSHSSQICSIDLLEESIGEAKKNKKTLFLAMEFVINKMKELEFQEEVAERAKREAAKGCLDTLTKAEDLRQILQHAKEVNDMHAGEVSGEKAILGTEVRELQSRIQNLSDERDKSLAILKEMSQTLETRLAAVEEETKMAKQEKVEKEKLAGVALAEQELAMESVVDESIRLQRQAEENAKLHDFLMDRGHVVDILQGEIAVICQDVKLLKEKFDEHVPISKSLSSSQTSCILASSSSSIKSRGSDRVPENVKASEAMEKTSPAHSVVSADTKKSLGDEWEFFDDEVLLG